MMKSKEIPTAPASGSLASHVHSSSRQLAASADCDLTPFALLLYVLGTDRSGRHLKD